jgi:flagellar biosynthesis protein FlhG
MLILGDQRLWSIRWFLREVEQLIAGKRDDKKLKRMRLVGSYSFPSEPDPHPCGQKDAPDDFVGIRKSCELISSHPPDNVTPSPEKSVLKRKIISVGSAKGGVGKSVFAANLGVFLSSKGFKTVIIDLDLGGTNVHLYLGKKSLLKQNINDFLKKRVKTLEGIMIESEYGPLLIGGGNSELGAANIGFIKKMRLIKAIEGINADYIILDLGGDMSYNSLDFFLRADYPIVMTTPDSASSTGAYHFIKAALYRKLNRMFGPESKFRNERNIDLERLIHKMLIPSDGVEVSTIKELMEKIKEQRPLNLPLVTKIISDFKPCLVLNKVLKDNNSHHVPLMIQDVARKWLSKEVVFLGGISTQPVIEQSVMDQVPAIARHPKGEFAVQIEFIADKLLRDK